jgi:hypothetical protein
MRARNGDYVPAPFVDINKIFILSGCYQPTINICSPHGAGAWIPPDVR